MNSLKENLDVVAVFSLVAILALSLIVGCLLEDYWAHRERMQQHKCAANESAA